MELNDFKQNNFEFNHLGDNCFDWKCMNERFLIRKNVENNLSEIT